MHKCNQCEAEQLINSYGGLPETKAYLRRYFKLNGGLRNKYPRTGALITQKMNELLSAILTVEGLNNGQ
ncbi:hypothetical protein APD05_07650 [Acinetobacter nosocomialis]|uniref:hypothetical protein n=1 Tax=Acinetobacter calcoaceticus/baumannii complex TaxID=909768 RepID=UPI0004F50E7B|nr:MULTISPECIES: hypothetical protein [Acinetobacter calcoaceticus/baumannii complex]KQD11417.1 hypothetical protein APD05_07650 [Acinetobacter nosocomialis]MCE5998357.1 hypothetical protein [Acinetobacter nosocomialis]HCU38799.1 hypothetical protein [Acinetobacter nosocomialis]